MARATVLGRLNWQPATIRRVTQESSRAVTLRLGVESWPGHLPGQHVDIRLTAEDGYQAQRSYSIASAPDDPYLELIVERIEDGEVSPWLTETAQTGDSFEIRGPIGGYFAWAGNSTDPVLLVAGGSGIAPLVAMARHRSRRNIRAPMRLLYSARSQEDLLFRAQFEELQDNDDAFEVYYTLTRAWPSEWHGFRRRVDGQMLADVSFPKRDGSIAFVCGPTEFVETVARILVLLGNPPARVKTERFGPSGGNQ